MSEGNLQNKSNLLNHGAVVAVRGSVVDIRFDAHLPPIYSLLHAKDGKIAIEVLAQLDAHRVRGIALTPTQGLARGTAVEDTGGPLKAPVGKGILSRMFDVFGNAIDRQAAPTDVQWRTVHRAPPPLARRSTKSEIFETGIKVIDVLVPLERGGKAGLFGGAGVGKTVLLAEMITGRNPKAAGDRAEGNRAVEQFRLPFDQHDDSGGFAADAGDCRGGKDACSAGAVAGVLSGGLCVPCCVKPHSQPLLDAVRNT